jgi:hypothetical protein
MTTTYPVKLALCLRPIWHQDPPRVRLGIGKNLTEVNLTETTTINFEFEASQSCDLTVELLNKQDSDTVPDQGLDKAVVIESVSFFGISDPRFVWSGVYEPTYPEPWYSQQTIKPLSKLKSHTYLCWNGKWTLTFDVPVFTWIHKIQDLGWIYD